MNFAKIERAASCLGGIAAGVGLILSALIFASPAAAQFVPAPNAPAIPRGAMALFIDPHTQIAIQFSVLDSSPGAYEKLIASPQTPAADQVYAALQKAGATVALAPQIITTSGIQAALSVKSQIPYQGSENGQTKTMYVNIGTTVSATPEIMANGTVALSIEYTRIDAAGDTKPGEPSATHTVSFTAFRELRPGESALLGVIKPITDYGTQDDEVIFVKVLSVKHM